VPAARGETRGYSGTEAPTATAAPGTYAAQGERPGGDPTEGQAYDAAATRRGTAGTAETEAAYDAATERKAVTPPDADARSDADTRAGTGSDVGSRSADTATATDQPGADVSGTGAQATPGAVTFVEQTAVLSPDDARTFQVRWETIQGTFIDDPHAATEQADALVGEVMDQLASLRTEYLRQLRGAIGDGSDTEAMRVALQRYRAFFQMLLG
jgi:hypothetical protein